MKKVYLGDGVYAVFDGTHVVLTTENGIATTNEIFLDNEVIGNLLTFIEELKQRQK
jgi:hypothetical protein